MIRGVLTALTLLLQMSISPARGGYPGPPPPPAPSALQSNIGTIFPSTTFTNPTVAGNTIVVWYSMSALGTSPVASDSQGNTYVKVDSAIFSGGSAEGGFYVATGIAGGVDVVSFNTYGATAVVIISEWTAGSGVEASHTCVAASTPPTSVGPITTTAANTTVLMGGGFNGPFGNGNSWGSINSGSNGSVFSNLFGATEASAGSYSNTLTYTGGNVVTCLIGLKA